MRKALAIPAAAAAVVLLAGCGGSHPVAGNHAGPIVPAPSGTGPAAPSGPFRIKVLYCGKFSKAQQNRYEDYNGTIFRYTNVSGSAGYPPHWAGYPDLTVNYVQGSNVVGYNVNGYEPAIAPGQSATGDVGGPGATERWPGKSTRCNPQSYTVTDSAGNPGQSSYTP